MANIRSIPPVKYFMGFIYLRDMDFEKILGRVSPFYGPFDLVSDAVPFTFTDYYIKEMGDNLLRRFASLERLMDPALLPDMKHATNLIEDEMGAPREGEMRRTVNLDPGYVEMGKMILATTKNQKHRIYLRSGIFAEVTLFWSKGAFHPFEWTYPDYRTDFAGDYLRKVMERYREQLRRIEQTVLNAKPPI